MNIKPAVTVLMAVYNGHEWISNAIESVLNQSFVNFELLIIDDGSTDSTSEVVKKYQVLDSRVFYKYKKNSGLADSLNFGVNFSRSEWIARLDADDLCYRTRLFEQYSYVIMNPDVVLIGSFMDLIDRFGNHLKNFSNLPSGNNDLIFRLVNGCSFFSHSSAFIKKSALIELGGYRISLKNACDTDLWLRLSEVGRITCLPSTLVAIRSHENQMTHNNAGYEQLVESYLARVSYIMRRSSLIDPLSININSDLQPIKKYIFDFLSDRRIIKTRNFVNLIKGLIVVLSIKNILLILFLCFVNFPQIIIHFKLKFYGDKFPTKMVPHISRLM